MAHEYYCEDCGQVCNPEVVDYGHGHFEHFGGCGVHVDKYVVSDCCEAALFHDFNLQMKADLCPSDYEGADPDKAGDDLVAAQLEEG